MRRVIAIGLVFAVFVGVGFAQQTGPIGQLRGRTDSGQNLVTALEAVATAHLAAIETAVEALQADVAAGSTGEYYISAGSTEDENEIDANAGVLMGISAFNNHASANAFIKCTNATAANTTPGTTTVIYAIQVPFGGGVVDRNINVTYATALTCYIVLGEADNDVAEVAANDVRYNIATR